MVISHRGLECRRAFAHLKDERWMSSAENLRDWRSALARGTRPAAALASGSARPAAALASGSAEPAARAPGGGAPATGGNGRSALTAAPNVKPAVFHLRRDVAWLLPLEEYEGILRRLPQVEEVRHKVKQDGATRKSPGEHWSPFELEVRIQGHGRWLTTAVTRFGHKPGDSGVHLYARGFAMLASWGLAWLERACLGAFSKAKAAMDPRCAARLLACRRLPRGCWMRRRPRLLPGAVPPQRAGPWRLEPAAARPRRPALRCPQPKPRRCPSRSRGRPRYRPSCGSPRSHCLPCRAGQLRSRRQLLFLKPPCQAHRLCCRQMAALTLLLLRRCLRRRLLAARTLLLLSVRCRR